jgi:Flp pilus assembly protein TadD
VVAGFSSEHKKLSTYIMDELAGDLAAGNIEVADRQNLEYLYRERDFQMSGDVDDSTAVSIGKILGAAYVLTGQFIKAGGVYCYRLTGINVESAVQSHTTRLTVRNDGALKKLIADIKKTGITATAAGYGRQDSAANYYKRGVLLLEQKDYDLAIECFSEALKIDPDYQRAYGRRGAAYAGKGDTNRAAADLNQAIKLNLNDGEAYYERGNIYYARGDNSRTITDYTAALRLNPNNAGVLNGRGDAYSNTGDMGKAIADYTAALDINPQDAFALKNRGISYYLMGDLDRAIADYNAASRLDPSNKVYRDLLQTAQNAKEGKR